MLKWYKHYIYPVITYFLVFPMTIFAGHGSDPDTSYDTIDNPLESETLKEFLLKVIDIFQTILTPVLVLALIYAGFKFVTARGNERDLAEAKKILLYTIIGIGIVVAAEVIAQIIGGTIQDIRID